MINFRVTDIQGGMLTIERPTGQAISLKLAEIVRAQVMEILPSGAVSLKLKGEQLIAKSQVPLQQGQSAFFKVTGLPIDGKDLMLQFIGVSDDKQSNTENLLTSQTSTSNKPPIMPLLKELQNLIEQLKSSKTEQNTKNLRLQELNTEILKSLPSDVQRLPKETRLQLQELLQNSLKLTGQSIQSKLSEILQNLDPEIVQSRGFENIKKELSLNIEQNLTKSFKGAIQDTGVALEAKLKNLAQVNGGSTLLEDANKLSKQPLDKELHTDTLLKVNPNEVKENTKGLITQRDNTLESQKPSSKGQPISTDHPQINSDLKAKLLQMKQDIQEFKDRLEDLIPQAKNNKAELSQISSKLSSVDSSLNKIDNLIKDIETFQALSKATNSFYTFLPVQWDNLKEGDISFKKGRRGNLQSYSCTINLDLKELGQLGIIVTQYGKDFYVSMRAENEGFQQKLSSNIKILDESFQSKGMNLKSARIFDYDKKEEFEMIEELSLDNRGVNISV